MKPMFQATVNTARAGSWGITLNVHHLNHLHKIMINQVPTLSKRLSGEKYFNMIKVTPYYDPTIICLRYKQHSRLFGPEGHFNTLLKIFVKVYKLKPFWLQTDVSLTSPWVDLLKIFAIGSNVITLPISPIPIHYACPPTSRRRPSSGKPSL